MTRLPMIEAETSVVHAPPQTERRYVYNGEPMMMAPRDTGECASRRNRHARRRKRSPFNIIAIIVTVSMLIVFYVWNKIMVNRLVVEVGDLQAQYERTLNANEFLRAEINKKSSLERIGKIATQQLGLIPPREQPVWFDVNTDGLAELENK
jgi:cell division protein FtsL